MNDTQDTPKQTHTHTQQRKCTRKHTYDTHTTTQWKKNDTKEQRAKNSEKRKGEYTETQNSSNGKLRIKSS